MSINRAEQEWPEAIEIKNIDHEGTKYEHSSTNVPIENRGQFNYCPLCNGWFPRR